MIKIRITVLVALAGIHFPSMAQQSGDPVETFEYFWNLFDESYASFKEKNIDWKEVYDTNRQKISASTSDAELFRVLSEIVKPLRDGHVRLQTPDKYRTVSGSRPSRIRKELEPLENGRAQFRAMTEKTLLKNGFSTIKEIGPEFRDEKLFSYSGNSEIGYVRFMRSFSKMPMMVGPSLDSQLDEIFNSFENKKAIIIDVRFNMGGDDRFSQKVVGRLIIEKMIGFRKQTRKKGEFGKLENRFIKPEGEKAFTKPVVLLTNDRTVSAADVLALIMEELPNVTIIGERSNGSYSDLYGKKLPNGWNVTLSNQRYFSVKMNNYEGLGTPVDIEAENTLKDVTSGNDSVLLVALDFVRKK